MQQLRNFGYYAAVLFNSMFAILSTVTLLGIIILTRPKQTMHNVPPEWWIPIAVMMIPAQAVCQYLTWKTIFSKEVPTPLAISQKQGMPQSYLRLPLGVMWAANFMIGFVIVVSLFKPDPGNNAGPALLALVALITLSLSTIANVYWMLLVRTVTSSGEMIKVAWHFRHVIDVAVSVTAVMYYRIAF